jgi:predicted O-methyltransferase YrrM
VETALNVRELQNGSYVCDDDPGEPGTGEPRISITDEEGKLLGFLCAGKRVLEIGTGLGVSTDFLACHAAKVVTVDVDPWVHTNIWPGLHKAVQCVAERDEVEGIFDVVFIDARHTTRDTRHDIQYARAKCPKGLIIVHDARIEAVHKAFDGDWHVIPTTHGVALQYVGWAE